MIRRYLILLPLLALFFVGCKTFTSNPGTTMTIVNRSSAPIHGIEVNYPGGVVGAAQIAPGKTFKKWVPTKDCKLQIKFLDAGNKEVPQTVIDLGRVCPKNVQIEIASDMSVTAREGQ